MEEQKNEIIIFENQDVKLEANMKKLIENNYNLTDVEIIKNIESTEAATDF